MHKFQEDALVISHQESAQGTFRLRLKAPRIAREARAGQFMMLQAREGMDPLLRRPFSFHRIFAGEGLIDVLYRVVGRGTLMLSKIKPGARLNLLGPLGNGFSLPSPKASPVLLVAGGIGIAPLFELMAQLRAGNKDGDIRLLYGARTAAELLSEEDLKDFGGVVHFSTDDGTSGYHGYVTQLLQDVAGGMQQKPVMLYACGPLAMQRHVGAWALTNGVDAQLSLESLMACGIGACLGCALPAISPDAPDSTEDHYVHVCKDGPIFPAGAIQWHKIQMHQTQHPIFLYS
jgi:dihydroorotate dehydrogenase electron transfer subunit